MKITAPADSIGRIWQQLTIPHRPGRFDGRRTAHVEVLETGWAMACDIQDILWETDDRADTFARFNDDLSFLAIACNLHYETRFRGPFSNTNSVAGHRAMRATDAAMLIMEIERLGFSVDASPLVAGLCNHLVRRKYLTNSELSVLWYEKQRHRCEMVVLASDNGTSRFSETVVTASGYTATALIGDAGPMSLRIDAPKQRAAVPLQYWIDAALSGVNQPG